MTSLEPKAKRCVYCGSHQVVDETVRTGNMIEIKRNCKICRRSNPVWEGTVAQHRVRRRVQRALKRQAS